MSELAQSPKSDPSVRSPLSPGAIRSFLAFTTAVVVLLAPAALADTTRFYDGSLEEGAASAVVRTTRDGGNWSFRRFDVQGLQVPCSDGSSMTLTRAVRDRVKIGSDRTFRTKGRNGDVDDGKLIRIAGTIRPRRANGVFEYFREKPGAGSVVCETSRLKWEASR